MLLLCELGLIGMCLTAINTTQAFGSPCFRAPLAPPVKHCHLVGNKCLTGRGAICLSQAFFSSGLTLHQSLYAIGSARRSSCSPYSLNIFSMFTYSCFISLAFSFFFLISQCNCHPFIFPEAQTVQNKCCVLTQPYVIDFVMFSC